MASKVFSENATFDTSSADLDELDFSATTSNSLDTMLAYFHPNNFQSINFTFMAPHLNRTVINNLANFNLETNGWSNLRFYSIFDSGEHQLPPLQTNLCSDTGYT